MTMVDEKCSLLLLQLPLLLLEFLLLQVLNLGIDIRDVVARN